MPKTRNYHDYLIKSLKKPEEAAAYMQAILAEKSPEPELLLVVLRDVVNAQYEISKMAQEDRQNWEKLQELLKASGAEEIYRFVALLKTLKFRTEIAVSEDSNLNIESSEEVSWEKPEGAEVW